MENDKIRILNKDMIKPKHKKEHEPYEYYKYDIANKSEGNKCCVSIYEIPPRKASYPYHYHISNEEVFYIISGEGILETSDGEKMVYAGDVIVCPPSGSGAHRLINASETEKLVYLDCDTINSPDVVYYPNSDKVGIIIDDKPGKFYRNRDDVDYYEKE